jgi:hypothetical protein
MGNWREENKENEMTIAEQIAASEIEQELVATATAQRRPIDVSISQDERPRKRTRPAFASSVLEHFSKFDFVCILSISSSRVQ